MFVRRQSCRLAGLREGEESPEVEERRGANRSTLYLIKCFDDQVNRRDSINESEYQKPLSNSATVGSGVGSSGEQRVCVCVCVRQAGQQWTGVGRFCA
ncbi:hypothetical protein RRG08_060934 [Elysia crispata]|uniref:Uncharacterized protein n=1 Tax=Elysia crispata TaxID=231223 RepID=A0AAE1E640_9GAST|nr:hypothetical protein RRG08_060934 [Elysia crispata]